MTPEQIKTLAKQAGGTQYGRHGTAFTKFALAEFVRLVREDALTEARWAIEEVNAERHIDVADCVQIIQELK